jgi:hypothetical protein
VPQKETALEPEVESNGSGRKEPVQRTWGQILIGEVRSHPFGYGVLAAAGVAGPVLISMIFPEVTTLQAIVGGLAFGVCVALCAVPQKFL